MLSKSQCRAVTRDIRRRSLTLEVQSEFQLSPCGSVVDGLTLGQIFLRVSRVLTADINNEQERLTLAYRIIVL